MIPKSDEFIEFGKRHTFQGGGGTDFKPVFEHADQLLEAGEQVDGVIYISDGWGDFPWYEKGPSYPVFFLLEEEYEDEDSDEFWINTNFPEWVECIRFKA